MRRSFCLLVLLLLAALAAPALAQDNVADWTYMQYFNMDNNLETALYNDLTEMQAAGSTDKVNLVAQVDRIPGYENRFGDWTDTQRFLLQHEAAPELTPDQKALAVTQSFLRETPIIPTRCASRCSRFTTPIPRSTPLWKPKSASIRWMQR